MAAPSAPRFVAQPTDVLIGEGGDAVFKASIVGGLLPINYQWQVSADGGSTWDSLTDGAGFSGSQTSSLTVTSVAASQSGLRFRCGARSEAGEGAPSSEAVLSVYVQPLAYDFSTLDVFTGHESYADGPGGVARFSEISGVVIDSTGVIYLSDSGSNTIRRISLEGTVATIAGTASRAGSLDGIGSAALFGTASSGGFLNIGPRGIAIGNGGVLYVTDTGNHTVRAIAANGAVTTLAGAAHQSGCVEGKGYYARFNTPSGIAIDLAGNLIIADTGNHVIRRVTVDGVSSTVAGVGGAAGYADGSAANARFSSPRGIMVDSAGNIYVVDTGNFLLRKIDGAGNVTTLAGTPGTSGWRDGAGTGALFGELTCVVTQPGGGLCVVDSSNHVLRTVSFAGEVRTWAGQRQVPGCADGPLYLARFSSPLALAFTGEGDAIVADSGNQTVRKIGPKGSVETIAGNAGWYYGGIYKPTGVAADAEGNVYVACPDNAGHAPDLVKMAPGKRVSFLSEHSGAQFCPEWAQCVAVDQHGVVYASAQHGLWRFPKSGERMNVNYSGWRSSGIAVDSGRNAYVINYTYHLIERFDRDAVNDPGEFFAGGGVPTPGANDGRGNAASFNYPQGVATGPDDMIYVADSYNHTIRKVTPDRVVSTIAGVAGRAGSLDGGRSEALFKGPVGIAVDQSGVIYVSDTGNHLIRRLPRDGSVTTIGGAVGQTGRADGAGGVARFSSPKGIAVVGAGVLFVADYSNNLIRRGDPRLAPHFLQHPAAVTTRPTGPVQFSAVASGSGELGYRWQASYNDGNSWTGLADGGGFQGTKTMTMTVTAPTASVSGVVFRCIASSTLGEGISAKARLVVLTGAPVITAAPPRTLEGMAGHSGSIGVTASGVSSYQWCRGGRPLAGSTAATLAFPAFESADAGLYDVLLAGPEGRVLSCPVVVGVVPASGVRTLGAVSTRAEWQDIHHSNGAVYDQFLLTGPAGTFTADPGQIARMSYLDDNGSIVQVEMSGAGAITVNLANATGPLAPALYNQSGIQYMKGKATIILAGADAATHFTIYSVGTATNPGVTRPGVTYAGWADVAAAGIISTDGALGGIHQGNANYNAALGYTGIYAPDVATVGGLVVVHGIASSDVAQPYLYFGSGGSVKVKIAGSSLAQPSGDSITVGGLAEVQMGAGQDSCGRAAPAQAIRGQLVNDRDADVTSALVVGP